MLDKLSLCFLVCTFAGCGGATNSKPATSPISPATTATSPEDALEIAGDEAEARRAEMLANGAIAECIDNGNSDACEIAADEAEAQRHLQQQSLEKIRALPPRDPGLDKYFVGVHSFAVNRVNGFRRTEEASITTQGEKLLLSANVRRGQHYLELNGEVHPVSREEFYLVGKIKGVPEAIRGSYPMQEVEGVFTFRATKGRRFWRLYEIDGIEDVCNERRNLFCYIDIGFRPPTRRK